MAAGSNSMTRIFGGSPLGVLVRLALLCIIVGLVMDQLDLDAFALLRHIARVIEEAIANSADLLRHVGRYFIIGAMVVIPIWILIRVFRVSSGRE